LLTMMLLMLAQFVRDTVDTGSLCLRCY